MGIGRQLAWRVDSEICAGSGVSCLTVRSCLRAGPAYPDSQYADDQPTTRGMKAHFQPGNEERPRFQSLKHGVDYINSGPDCSVYGHAVRVVSQHSDR